MADGRYAPRGDHPILFTRSTGGDEVYRIHLFDPTTKSASPVSPEGRRAGAPEWNPAGDRIVFTTVPIDRNNASREVRTIVHLVDPQDPGKARALADLPGAGWSDFTFSPDGARLAYIEFVSAELSHVWMMEVATGKRRRLTPAKKGEPVFYADPQFSPDGKALFVVSDRGSEFRHLAWIEIATGRERALSANLKFDVEGIALSPAAGLLAFITNEAGAHVLRFLDLATRKELPRPALVPGVISGMRWHRNGCRDRLHARLFALAGRRLFLRPEGQPRHALDQRQQPGTQCRGLSRTAPHSLEELRRSAISGFLYHHPAVAVRGLRP